MEYPAFRTRGFLGMGYGVPPGFDMPVSVWLRARRSARKHLEFLERSGALPIEPTRLRWGATSREERPV